MAFPQIQIKTTHTEIDERLKDLVHHKLQSLEKFLKRVEDVRCDVELEKLTDHHTGNIFRAEVNLFVGGTLYRGEATQDSFEKAIDEVRGEIKKELRRASGKRESLYKRGKRKIKEMIRWRGS